MKKPKTLLPDYITYQEYIGRTLPDGPLLHAMEFSWTEGADKS
jgi:hypothetical protein